MKNRTLFTTLALGLAAALSLNAQDMPMPGPENPAPEPPDNFHKHLFEPEMIMACQAELKMTDEQSQAIKSVLTSTRAELIGLEWDLNQAVTALGKALAATQVDENTALGQLDKVLDLERNIKRNNLKLAIQLKNKLTPEQQEMLNHKRQEKARRGMFNRGTPQMQRQSRPGGEGFMPQGRPPGGEGFMPNPGRPGGEEFAPQGRRGGEGPMPPRERPGREGPTPPKEGPAGEPPAPPQEQPEGKPPAPGQ